MDLVLERCSVVLVGAWNLAIFSPEWVGGRLFPDEAELQFGFGTGAGVGAAMHYRTSKLRLTASAGRLEIKPLHEDDECFATAGEAARDIVRLLPETPLVGCGVNVGFDTHDIDVLRDSGQIADEKLLVAAGVSIVETRTDRTITFDGVTFSFSVHRGPDPGVLKIDFNYHCSVSNSQQALSFLERNAAQGRARSTHFLEEVYRIGKGAT